MSKNESSKKDRRIHKTELAIHKALLQLVESQDVSRITVTELTNLADINRKTFYNHYSNIADVIDEMENVWADNLHDIIAEVLSPYSKTRDMDFEQIRAHAETVAVPFFKTTITELKKHPSWFKIIEANNGRNNLMNKIVAREKTLLSDTFGGNFTNNTWLEYFLIFSINGGLAMIEEWYRSNFPVSIDELADFFRVMFTSDAVFDFILKKS